VIVHTVVSVPEGAFVLDVRELHEWEAGHAPDAVHIPLGDLASRSGELPTDRVIVAVCKAGGRSARATLFLRERGFDVHNYDGGMHAWAQAGGPMVSTNGAEPRVA
jgi:rhodanese-related sulfurtransferase